MKKQKLPPRPPSRFEKDRLIEKGRRHKIKISGGEAPAAFRRVPLVLDYWVATRRGRMPIGPYRTPGEALVEGHTLGLKRLWWVETEAIGDL